MDILLHHPGVGLLVEGKDRDLALVFLPCFLTLHVIVMSEAIKDWPVEMFSWCSLYI